MEDRKEAEKMKKIKEMNKGEQIGAKKKKQNKAVGGCSFGNSGRSGRIPPDWDISEEIPPDWKNYSHMGEFLEEFFHIGRILSDLEEFTEKIV